MTLQPMRLVVPPLSSLVEKVFGRSRPQPVAGLTGEVSPVAAEVPPGTRVYAVGDVHGRADLLGRVFELIDADRAAAEAATDIEVMLGDYIDRGPDSREVIEMLAERAESGRMVCLLGNHEAMLLEALDAPERMPEWLANGGRETLISYGIAPGPSKSAFALHAELREALPERHRAFLEHLSLSWTCGDYFFAHAGVDPGLPIDRQRPEDLLWIRDRFLRHTGPLGKVVVHGHTPRMQPEIGPCRISIDTGAYITGRLTCLVLDEARRRFL